MCLATYPTRSKLVEGKSANSHPLLVLKNQVFQLQWMNKRVKRC